MFNETTKEYIYGYKYNTSGELTFSNGSVNDGDVISITLSSDKIDTVTQKFTYKKNGNVELNVAQKGGYSITGSGDLYTNAYLLDSEGKVVKSDVTKADINEANISGGKDQLLVVRTNEQYVNTLTSLETKNGYFEAGKFPMLRDGTIYPIPKKDDSLKRFGGVDKRVIKNIPLSSIKDVGKNYVAEKHHYYIKKYLK